MKKLFPLLILLPFQLYAEPVNINTADAETISKALNGVGPKKAEAIIQYRKEHGDFKTLKDLENVSGIGEKTIKLNEKDILLSDAPAGEARKDEPVKPVAADKPVSVDKKAK